VIYLVDTNALLRFADRSHHLHAVVRNAVRKLRQEGHSPQIASQNCIEFWNVATRPSTKNGFGLTTVNAEQMLRLIERIFPLLLDRPATYPTWRQLVLTFNVAGVQVHDARLVATMLTNDVTHILTLNTADFVRYAPAGIVAIDPAAV